VQKRKLGFTDMEITTCGFGAWAAGGGNWEWGWGPQDDAESVAAIQRDLILALTGLILLLRTVWGIPKKLFGRRSGIARKVFIATKCGLWDNPSTGTVYNRLQDWSVRQEAENSRRLGVDVIDLYQIHWPKQDSEIEEGWTEIARLVEEGKIRYAGVSNFSLEQIQRAQRIHPVASVQPEYSMLERSIENDLLAYCAEQQIGVIAYSPMASGLLTGKYTRATMDTIAADDWRRKFSDHFREPALPPILALRKTGTNCPSLEPHPPSWLWPGCWGEVKQYAIVESSTQSD
jgi:aryl-alcohol dehydrogenase-like predicted oxidoreductase